MPRPRAVAAASPARRGAVRGRAGRRTAAATARRCAVRWVGTAACSSAACTSTSTGCWWRPSWCLCGIGVAMIYSTSGESDAHAHGTLQVTQVYAIVLGLRGAGRLPDGRLPHADRQVAPRSIWACSALLRVRAALRVVGRWAPAAGLRCRSFNLQPSEFAKVGVRARARQVLRREPARAPRTGRPAHRRRR